MDRQRVAGLRTHHEERPGLRIAEQGARHAAFVHAARIDGGGMHRIARPDRQHRRACGAEFIRILFGREFVPLRGGGCALRQAPRGEAVLGAGFGVIGIRHVGAALQAVGGGCPFVLVAIALLVGDGEADAAFRAGAVQAVAIERAGQVAVLLLQMQRHVGGIAPPVEFQKPAFGGVQRQGKGKQRQQECFFHGLTSVGWEEVKLPIITWLKPAPSAAAGR
ncbi:hypothetical protein MJ904_20080 [Massilia sp. MB5]|uniref:hypothetical protein n=1 Tax=Massilia sp. MB5 TaxID=2919578 RepID=UPI001F0FD805|nr:hypothetical protein [Massilia sp. MB5]UMR29353.1 hypothetical protein MJ904_20080 [Massilia sp. MB5]